jgi:hypothetical protein
MQKERVNLIVQLSTSLIAARNMEEAVKLGFQYNFKCFDKAGRLKWRDSFLNTVVTVGKNDLLDKYFAGSAYTAAFFLGLIDNAGFTAIAAGDTMASHAGWAESSAYTQGTRPALVFAGASGGSKATSAPSVFSINTNSTVLKGAFVTTNSTKGGTTGVLFSAGAFAANRSVESGDTLNVNLTVSA